MLHHKKAQKRGPFGLPSVDMQCRFAKTPSISRFKASLSDSTVFQVQASYDRSLGKGSGKQNSRPNKRIRYNKGGNILTDAPALHHWLDKLKLNYFLSPKSVIEFTKIDRMTQIHNVLLIEGSISIIAPQSSAVTCTAASE